MSYINPEGIVIPAGTDQYNLTPDLRTMAASTRSVVPVANSTSANAVIAAMASDGRPVSDTNPLVTWDAARKKLLVYNASGVSWGVAPHAEFTVASNTAAPNTVWGFGSFVQDAANTTDTGFVTINATDKLQVRDAGIYIVSAMVSFTAVISGVSWISVDGIYTTTMGGGLQSFMTAQPNWNLGAGAIINPTLAVGTAGNATFASRVRVTRIA